MKDSYTLYLSPHNEATPIALADEDFLLALEQDQVQLYFAAEDKPLQPLGRIERIGRFLPDVSFLQENFDAACKQKSRKTQTLSLEQVNTLIKAATPSSLAQKLSQERILQVINGHPLHIRHALSLTHIYAPYELVLTLGVKEATCAQLYYVAENNTLKRLGAIEKTKLNKLSITNPYRKDAPEQTKNLLIEDAIEFARLAAQRASATDLENLDQFMTKIQPPAESIEAPSELENIQVTSRANSPSYINFFSPHLPKARSLHDLLRIICTTDGTLPTTENTPLNTLVLVQNLSDQGIELSLYLHHKPENQVASCYAFIALNPTCWGYFYNQLHMHSRTNTSPTAISGYCHSPTSTLLTGHIDLESSQVCETFFYTYSTGNGSTAKASILDPSLQPSSFKFLMDRLKQALKDQEAQNELQFDLEQPVEENLTSTRSFV